MNSDKQDFLLSRDTGFEYNVTTNNIQLSFLTSETNKQRYSQKTILKMALKWPTQHGHSRHTYTTTLTLMTRLFMTEFSAYLRLGH